MVVARIFCCAVKALLCLGGLPLRSCTGAAFRCPFGSRLIRFHFFANTLVLSISGSGFEDGTHNLVAFLPQLWWAWKKRMTERTLHDLLCGRLQCMARHAFKRQIETSHIDPIVSRSS